MFKVGAVWNDNFWIELEVYILSMILFTGQLNIQKFSKLKMSVKYGCNQEKQKCPENKIVCFKSFFLNPLFLISKILHLTIYIHITGHEGPWGMWMQRHTYTQPRNKEEVRWLVLCSAAFTPGEIPGTHFIGGWVDRRTWRTRRSEQKSPPLRHPGSNPGRPARSEAPCRLSHLAHF